MSQLLMGNSGRIYKVLSDADRQTVQTIENATGTPSMNDIKTLLIQLIYLIADGEKGIN